MREHYYRKNQSYCSDIENIYFLFHDHAKNTIKDEYLIRKYRNRSFHEH